MDIRFITHQSFFSAVRSGDLESLKSIIRNECSDPASISNLMSLQNDGGETPIFVAVDANLEDVFNYLLNFCDLQTLIIRTKSGMDAFHLAARRGYLGIVKELSGRWPELCKVCDSTNTSPLYSAAVQDHLEVVNAIIDADVDSIKIVRKNGKTALHTAARYGLLRIAKSLIERDPAVVRIKDKKGQTALHMAVKGHDTTIVEELLLADHSILNETDKKGNTAVHIATRKNRAQIVSLLLSYTCVNVNAINNQNETAMDLADKLQYGESSLEIKESLTESGAMHARQIGQANLAKELKRAVSDIKHEVHSQLIQNEKTQRRVSGIARELKKIHREAVQNTINSVTVVAVLFASIAFLAIFNLPGQYVDHGSEAGKANIANIATKPAFRAFCILNATSLFISLAVVVVQITLVAWDTRAQRQIVSVVNKLMWAACVSTCGAFLSIAFLVVGKHNSWMAITIVVVGVPMLLGTLVSLCYFVFRQHFGSDSQRRIKRATGSKSFSWSYSANISDFDDDDESDHEKIYAL